MQMRRALSVVLFALRPGLTSFFVFLLATAIPWKAGSFVVMAAGVALVMWTFKTAREGEATVALGVAGSGLAMAVVALLAVSAIGGAVGGVMLGSGRPWLIGTFTLMVVPALAATSAVATAMALRRRETGDVKLGA
jgi:hypothetical protein